MSANVNDVGMHSCKVCNKEIDTEKALWLHMKAHGIHHYFSSQHPSYLDQRRKHVVALPSGPQLALKDPREPDLGSCMVLLSNGTLKPLAVVLMGSASDQDRTHDPKVVNPEPVRVQDQRLEPQLKGKFECKACNKVFNSHQALGGHRASHKKVKGCFAANVVVSNLDSDDNQDQDDPPPASITTVPDDSILPSKKPNKSHECSICHKIFPSGQALGGHKRCHWLPYTLPPPPPPPPNYQTTTVPPPTPPPHQQPVKFHNFLNVDESRSQNSCNPNKKPRYNFSPPFPSLGIALDISGGTTNAGPRITFLGSTMSKKTKTSHYNQSRHFSYKCKTTLSLFNDDEDSNSMSMEMQWKGKPSSWLNLGVASSTTTISE